MPDEVGAPASTATGGAAQPSADEQALIAQLVGQGMSLAEAIIIAAGGGTQLPTTPGQPVATVGHTVGWRANWPILAAAGAIAFALVLRR